MKTAGCLRFRRAIRCFVMKNSAMKSRSLCFVLFSLLAALLPAYAQDYDAKVAVTVSAANGTSLAGLEFELFHTGYSMTYPKTVLDDEGKCTVDVYSGEQRITIEKEGFIDYVETFSVVAGETKELDVVLQEDVRNPFSLRAELQHDAYTGKDGVLLTWNKEEPSFFDDFESYDAFAVQFGEWTGIDGDGMAAAPIQGDYPNRGSMQYAQIINPLEVEPVWWYDYPVLRPYSGKQYVGFVRTASGYANDDWLISPAIEVKNDNLLRFMAKAADVYPERFEVGVAVVGDAGSQPEERDFDIISSGNYETVSYEQWQAVTYDLSDYAGQTVKIGIHYISDANRYGAFMLMVDDFYVGQPDYGEAAAVRARRVAQRSPANPNESFKLYKNGQEIGTTDGYSYLFENLEPGDYTFGVKAVYKSGVESGMSEIDFAVPAGGYSEVVFNVSVNNSLSPDGLTVDLVSVDTSDEYAVTVTGGKAVISSLPFGSYVATVSSEMYEDWSKEFVVGNDAEIDVELIERIFTPYNISADVVDDEQGAYTVTVKWNQDLGFSDSFEDYDDFAQESFGDWLSVDVDKMPAMPIALGTTSNYVQVTFPGASTTDNLTEIAPIVFNPSMTEPSLSVDPWFTPVSGNKEIIFFNPYGDQVNITPTDKWLISPLQAVRDNYVVRFWAVGYDWPEELEICVSTTDTEIDSFTKEADITTSCYGEWTQYEMDLSKYSGQSVYIGIHCVSVGGWVCLFDDFYVGPAEEGELAYVGNVLSYEVFLDGVSQGTTDTPSFAISGVAPGRHTIGIEARYASGVSERAEYTFSTDAGIEDAADGGVVVYGASGAVCIDATFDGEVEVFTLAGQRIVEEPLQKGNASFAVPAGMYVVKFNGKAYKVMVR